MISPLRVRLRDFNESMGNFKDESAAGELRRGGFETRLYCCSKAEQVQGTGTPEIGRAYLNSMKRKVRSLADLGNLFGLQIKSLPPFQSIQIKGKRSDSFFPGDDRGSKFGPGSPFVGKGILIDFSQSVDFTH